MKSLLKLSLLLTFLLSTGICSAQVKLVKVLPNGEPIFEWNGAQYRGLTEAHADRIDRDLFEYKKLQDGMPLCRQEVEALRSALSTAHEQVVSSDRLVTLANDQSASQQRIAMTWKAMFDDEHQLRLEAQKFVHRGRVSSFFDKPAVQLFVKVGLPIAGIILTKTAK